MTDTSAPADASGAETLSELYARDPFTLTRDGPEIHRMVDTLRTQRVHFAAAPNAAAGKARAPKVKAEKIKNLDDLKLDL